MADCTEIAAIITAVGFWAGKFCTNPYCGLVQNGMQTAVFARTIMCNSYSGDLQLAQGATQATALVQTDYL